MSLIIHKQPTTLIILHLFLVLFYLSLFFVPIIYLDRLGEYAFFILIGIYIIIVSFGVRTFYPIRHQLVWSLETIINIEHKIEIDHQGVSCHSIFKNEEYNWKEIDQIIRESDLQKNINEILVTTKNSKIFHIVDDTGWNQFKILKKMVTNTEIIDYKVLYTYKDPETGLILETDDLNEITK